MLLGPCAFPLGEKPKTKNAWVITEIRSFHNMQSKSLVLAGSDN